METTEKKEIEIVREKVAGAIEAVKTIAIKTDDDLNRAGAVLVNIKKLAKFLTQEKEKITKPMNEALKNARAIFKPMEEQIENAENQVSRAMATYADKVEQERKKKEESIAARAEKGQLKEETAVRKMEELGDEKKTIHNEGGSVTFTKIKKVRFADLGTLSAENLYHLISVGCVVWNEVEARKAALAGLVTVGVEIYEETTTNTRS